MCNTLEHNDAELKRGRRLPADFSVTAVRVRVTARGHVNPARPIGEKSMDVADNDSQARVALVTGASRGIGRATCLALAAAGFHIIALARTQGALEELDDEINAAQPGVKGLATLVPCDLRDQPAIDRLREALYKRWGRLDALVGNAGLLGPLSPLHHVEPKQWDDVLATNVTANWRLIRALDPLLRAAPAGRAVVLSLG